MFKITKVLNQKKVQPKKPVVKKTKGKFKAFKISKYIDNETITMLLHPFTNLNKDLDILINNLKSTSGIVGITTNPTRGFNVSIQREDKVYPVNVKVQNNTVSIQV